MISGVKSGTTPLDADEAVGLIEADIKNREELDTWEWSNITRAEQWAFSRRHPDLLSPDFIRTLHRRMFGETWRWAGRYRTTDKNIGIASEHIATAVHDLCADVRTQLDGHVYGIDEIAARFSHRLVWIHPFVNGNGRHARMLADLFLVDNSAPRFTWGSGDLRHSDGARQRYLSALRRADAGDFAPLLAFVRS